MKKRRQEEQESIEISEEREWIKLKWEKRSDEKEKEKGKTGNAFEYLTLAAPVHLVEETTECSHARDLRVDSLQK